MTVTVWKYPKRDEWKAIMARPQMDLISLSRTVSDILESVRCEGDDALRRYEKQFDRVVLEALQVTPAEMEEGVAAVPESLKKAIRQAIDNIRKFHASQAIEVKKSRNLARGVVLAEACGNRKSRSVCAGRYSSAFFYGTDAGCSSSFGGLS